VFCASPAGELAELSGQWVVELVLGGSTDTPVRFCAATKEDALAWQQQLRRRGAPLAAVWERHMDMGGGSNGLAPVRADAGVFSALASGAGSMLSSSALAGVAGVAAALTCEEAADLASAAGPIVGIALSTLSFALSVLVAAREAAGAAAEASSSLNALHASLRGHLLPALRDLGDGGGVDVADLIGRLGALVANLEVLAGELHHTLRSRRARAWLACSSTGRGVGVGDDMEARMSESRRDADHLLQLVQLAYHRKVHAVATETLEVVVAGPAQAAQAAAEKLLPALPSMVFVDWANPELPPVQLYQAVMSGANPVGAVGAHGMGGTGKTLSCLLTAHRVATEVAGKERFPDGVCWFQLYRDVTRAEVHQRLCALATTLGGSLVEAVDLDMAVERLRTALVGKSCLLVVDDVWHVQWVSLFIKAMEGNESSALLVSTRQRAVASSRRMSRCVEVGALCGPAATGVLLVHAERSGVVQADKTDERVGQAVDLCDGLALALSVMGGLVLAHGWASALVQVGRQRAALLLEEPTGTDKYASLWACLLASYAALGEDEGNCELWRERFRALCVLRSKEQLPWSALAALWDEDSLDVTKEIAQTLRNYSLVSVQDKGPNEPLLLSLHDLVVEFLARPKLLSQTERSKFHAQLVAGYCRRSGVVPIEKPVEMCGKRVTIRPVWMLPSDGFIEASICHLLRAGGAADELRVLLFDMRFVAWRITLGACTCGVYRADCHGLGLDVLNLVATVVEGAVANKKTPMPMRLNQAAWEVTERLRLLSVDPDHGANAPLLSYFCESARSFLTKPTVELYGATRLDVPRYSLAFSIRWPVDFLCSVVTTSGVTLLVTASIHSPVMEVWNVDRGMCKYTFDGHDGPMRSLVVLDRGGGGSGARVVSASDDATVRVWDVERGACLAVLRGHTSPVRCVVAAAGREGGTDARIVAGADDGTLRVWDVDSWLCSSVLEGHDGPVLSLLHLDDSGSGHGARLLSGSRDGAVRVWELSSGSCLTVLEGHTAPVLCLTPLGGGVRGTGARIVSGSEDGTARVWDVEGGTCVSVLDGHTLPVLCLAILDGGGNGASPRIVTGSRDKTVRVWGVDGAPLMVLRGNNLAVMCLDVLGGGDGGSGQRLVSGARDSTVRVWDVDRGVCTSVLTGHNGPVLCSALLARGGDDAMTRVASGSFDTSVRVWDIDSEPCLPSPNGHTDWVQCLVTLPAAGSGGGPRIASGADDGVVRLWDVDSGSSACVLRGHTGPVDCLLVWDDSPRGDGLKLISGSRDGTVRVWEVATGTCLAVLEGHTDWVTCLALLDAAGDGKLPAQRLVSGSRDKSPRVWDLARGSCDTVLEGHTNGVSGVVVLHGSGSGGGDRIVTSSGDESVRVWDAASGSCLSVMRGKTGKLFCMVFVDGGGGDGGGALVATGTWDGPVHVWDVDRGALVAELTGHPAPVSTLAVMEGDGDGRAARLVSGCYDGSVRVWRVGAWTCEAAFEGPHRWTMASPARYVPPAPAAAADGRGCLAAGVFLMSVIGECGAFLDIHEGRPRLRLIPCPPSLTAVVSVAGSRVVWGTKTGPVYFSHFAP